MPNRESIFLCLFMLLYGWLSVHLYSFMYSALRSYPHEEMCFTNSLIIFINMCPFRILDIPLLPILKAFLRHIICSSDANLKVHNTLHTVYKICSLFIKHALWSNHQSHECGTNSADLASQHKKKGSRKLVWAFNVPC